MNVKISLTCVPALGPLFTYFREKTLPNPSSSRRNPFDWSEMQSNEGTINHASASRYTNPYLSASESDPYSKLLRSHDHDGKIGITCSEGALMNNHHSLDLKTKEIFPQEVCVQATGSSGKHGDPIG